MRDRQAAGLAMTGFLRRLAHDKRGNTLMLVAAAIFPLVAVVGGGVDAGRLYLVKTRLQHACDAGALAGRKQMGGGNWTTTGTASSDAVARQLFVGNFPSNAYGATNVTKSFSEAAGTVNGTASATVPMTLMAVFAVPAQTLTVSCSAQEQVPNTDVMFVLDNTESMSEHPDGSAHVAAGGAPDAQSKIVALKAAVKCFFEALSKLNTNEPSCDPIAGVATSARLRFGMVPYATNVNISNLDLPDSYFANKWDYQGRTWSGSDWTYKQVSYSFTNFDNATTSISLKQGAGGANKSFNWDGCTEEDLPLTDINVKPGGGNKSRYAPTIPGAVYYRNESASAGNVNPNNLQSGTISSTADLFVATKYPYYSCPNAPAYPLEEYGPTKTPVNTFNARVDAMKHEGNTRHDIGMLWGGRLISPRGIFSPTNGTPPNNGPLFRHVVFMTDGDAKANECDYATYGIPWYDQREVSSGTTVSKTSCNNLGQPNTTLTDNVYTRLGALCTAIKAENNTIVWVISFGGTGIQPSTKSKLTSCASDANHFFDATDTATLKSAFKKIAAQISQLRLTQ